MVTAKEQFEKHLNSLKAMAAENNIEFGSLLSMLVKRDRNPLADLVRPGASTAKLIGIYKQRYYEDQLNWCYSLIEKELWPKAKQYELDEPMIKEAEKVLKQQKVALASGRHKAVASRQKTAKERREKLTGAIDSLFDAPSKPGWRWGNKKIVEFLSPKFKSDECHYSDSTITYHVNRIAARHRAKGK